MMLQEGQLGIASNGKVIEEENLKRLESFRQQAHKSSNSITAMRMKVTLADRIKSQVLNEKQKAKSENISIFDQEPNSGSNLTVAKSESLKLAETRKNYSLNSEVNDDESSSEILVDGLSNFGGNK